MPWLKAKALLKLGGISKLLADTAHQLMDAKVFW